MKANQLKGGIALSYVNMGLQLLVSLLFTPVMLRLLGQSEYGLYNLVASVVSNLSLLSFGFGSAYIRYHARFLADDDEEGIARLNGMYITLFTVIGVVALLAGSVLIRYSEPILGSQLSQSEHAIAKVLMAVMVLNLAVTFPLSVFNSYISANEAYLFQRVMQIVKTVTSPLVMLPALLLGFGSIGIVWATTILNILLYAADAVYCIRRLGMKFRFRDFDFSLMKDLTIFSSYIFINMLVDQINWNLDKYIIGRFRGAQEVAVYGVGSLINTYYRQIALSISTVFVPRINRMVATTDDSTALTGLMTRVGRIQAMILLLISSGFIFFGRPFVNLWAGEAYDASYAITLWLIVPTTIPLVQTIGLEIQRARNMHKFRSITYLFVALGNLLVSIPLTWRYGGIGAAAGTGLATFIGHGLIMNWYYTRRMGLDMAYFWRQIIRVLPAFVLPVGAGMLLNQLVDLYQPLPLLAGIAVYALLAALSMWLWGMNNDEKDQIRIPLKRIAERTKNRDRR